jgi:adenylate kinase family enzyme
MSNNYWPVEVCLYSRSLTIAELASEELIATLLAKKVVSILSNEESEKNETPEKTNATVDTPTETTPQSILDIQHPGIVKTNNIIVEGYPRNREQGSKLMDMFSETGFRKQSTLVLHLMCDKDTIKKRLKGRLIDVPSGRTYHVEYRPPKQDQLDDVTQRPLTRRDDDSITEVIQNRLETYKDKTLPTIEMLTENGLTVLDIPSSGSIESVHERIKKEVLSFFKVPASKEAPKEAAKEVLKEGPKEEQKEVPKEAEKEAAKSEK